jgi:cysteine sulfinate desulfinase/cysteine desulfurase-like protein
MKQSCNKKEKKEQIVFLSGKNEKNTLTIRNFFKTLKNRNKMKTYKINIFKHETKREIQ